MFNATIYTEKFSPTIELQKRSFILCALVDLVGKTFYFYTHQFEKIKVGFYKRDQHMLYSIVL